MKSHRLVYKRTINTKGRYLIMVLQTAKGPEEYKIKDLDFTNVMCDLEDMGETEANADIIRECAQRTVINKVSQDEEAIAEVATGCIDAKFGECSMYE